MFSLSAARIILIVCFYFSPRRDGARRRCSIDLTYGFQFKKIIPSLRNNPLIDSKFYVCNTFCTFLEVTIDSTQVSWPLNAMYIERQSFCKISMHQQAREIVSRREVGN